MQSYIKVLDSITYSTGDIMTIAGVLAVNMDSVVLLSGFVFFIYFFKMFYF